MKKVYRLEDLDCANCAAKMERAISKIEGVQSASVSFLMQRLMELLFIPSSFSARCGSPVPPCGKPFRRAP